ncbi:hypothetical protein [Ferrimonas balearica]|uniref:hypothetical protein n=1 Tax=Ferrimonas balearica TaxID=44012 RepID=UPI001C9928F4|nr:hypothetical protein [Ferrimonas balearica]MBY5991276.1 hypothetical protein [Ferrimonas balearica]
MRLALLLICAPLLGACSSSIWHTDSVQSWNDLRLCQFHAYFADHGPMQDRSADEIARRQAEGGMSLSQDECRQVGEQHRANQASYSHAYWLSQGLDHSRL